MVKEVENKVKKYGKILKKYLLRVNPANCRSEAAMRSVVWFLNAVLQEETFDLNFYPSEFFHELLA